MPSTPCLAKNIWDTALQECEAMVDHAFSVGKNVPSDLMTRFAEVSCAKNNQAKQPQRKQSDDETTPPATDFMVSHAEQLTAVHNQLAEIVAPASPRSLLIMHEQVQRGSVFLVFGRVPFIRYMMFVAILALVMLITLSLSSEINNNTIVMSIFENKGSSLLKVQLLFLAAAALGASFSALFKANQYIVAGTFDPKHETSYWVRFVVGLIAGIIMTQIIPTSGLEEALRNSPVMSSSQVAKNDNPTTAKTTTPTATITATTTVTTNSANSNPVSVSSTPRKESSLRDAENAAGMVKITLALLGGFSASLVYLVLNRLVDALKYFMEPTLAAQQKANEASLKNEFGAERLQTRSQLIAGLLKLQNELTELGKDNPEKIQQRLNEYMQQTLKENSNPQTLAETEPPQAS